ncbi:MAG: 3-methyl-2-oxobutanoate hydroxymethyltransferase [Chloroflexi bacterium]|nr:3-methyl-2-oxobutanoate hydroxymethyltransferase [Chloroflexota bacterium]
MATEASRARRVTAASLRRMKAQGERITMLTAYDYRSARLFDAAGVDVLLVGDSLGMVVLGYDSTIPVTVDDILHHTRAVVRGTQRALVVADLPFMSYTISREQALTNAARLIQDGGAQVVKLEGGRAVAPTVAALVESGMPVMGHIGLTPQAIHRFGGYRVQGRTKTAAQRLVDEAHALEDAGACALVLELIPAPLAARITASLKIPTIGIGAGPHCDGQVQVMHDMLGLQLPDEFIPKHAKQYAGLGEVILGAVLRYGDEVRAGTFPTEAQSFTMEERILAALGQSDDGDAGRAGEAAIAGDDEDRHGV